MYDLAFFRNNLDTIAKRLADRGFTLDVGTFRSMDEQRRKRRTTLEGWLARRKSASEEIARLIKTGEDAQEKREEVRKINEQIAQLEESTKDIDEIFMRHLKGVP